MSDVELWRCVSHDGTTLTAVRREIHNSQRHPADGLFRLELRSMNGRDLHGSETFHTEQELQRRSDEFRRLLVERGWHQQT